MFDPANRYSWSMSNYTFAVVVDAQILTVNTEVGVCGAGCSWLVSKSSEIAAGISSKALRPIRS